jgi:hypothetical protein
MGDQRRQNYISSTPNISNSTAAITGGGDFGDLASWRLLGDLIIDITNSLSTMGTTYVG